MSRDLAAAPGPPRSDYLRELDSVRAIAFLLVLWYHLPLSLFGPSGRALAQWLDAGYLGVNVFFVLSGFVVTRVLLSDRARGASLGGFYLRRVLRIFPIYYLLLAIVAVVDPLPGLGWCAVYLANYHMIDGGDLRYLGHLWSLSVEEHFYLVWPTLLLLAGARRGPTVVVTVLMPVVAITVWYYFAHDQVRLVGALTYATTSRLGALAIGTLFAFWERGIRRAPWRATWIALGMAAAALLVSEWLLTACGLAARIVHSGFPQPERLLPVLQLFGRASLCGAIVLLVIAWSGTAAALAVALRWQPLRWIGSISYGLYLYHLPILFLFDRPSLDADTGRARWLSLLAVATTFAVAALSFRFVEHPLIRLGRRGRADQRSS